MLSITIKGISSTLHERLKGIVRRLHRSLQNEVIACLERYAEQPPRSKAELMGLVANSACSAYDCECVALAWLMGYPLVTEVARIVRTFPETAVTMDDLRAGQ